MQVRVNRRLYSHKLLIATLREFVPWTERLEESYKGSTHPWHGSLVPASFLVCKCDFRIGIGSLRVIKTETNFMYGHHLCKICELLVKHGFLVVEAHNFFATHLS